jgi:hypothetical protein
MIELMAVEYLLRLEYKCMAPKSDHSRLASHDGIIYVNPPTCSKDYDDAYNEAKRLFFELYGENEGFLVKDETNEVDNDEE